MTETMEQNAIKCCATCDGFDIMDGACSKIQNIVHYQGPFIQVTVHPIGLCGYWNGLETEAPYRKAESG